MVRSPDYAAVVVRLETTLELETFAAEACGLDAAGNANDLEIGTEYMVLTSDEVDAYSRGDYSIRAGSIDGDPKKFIVIFPRLDSMKESITAVRKA